MKKIILFFALMTGLNSFAQTETLTIYNYTNCAINFTLFAYVAGTDCGNDAYQSKDFLILYPNSSISFDDFSLYGSATYNWFDNQPNTSITDSQLNAMGDARFIAFKTNDGTSISIGLENCGAGTDTTISDCNGTPITATFEEEAPFTKTVKITD